MGEGKNGAVYVTNSTNEKSGGSRRTGKHVAPSITNHSGTGQGGQGLMAGDGPIIVGPLPLWIDGYIGLVNAKYMMYRDWIDHKEGNIANNII